MSLLRNDSTTLAKDLPPVVNDDRPDLATVGAMANDKPNSADKKCMDDNMKEINAVVGD
jgi:hypothetical protein